MLAKVKSAAVVGLDAVEIQVEVDVSSGQSKVIIVGLPDTAVQEAGERVRAAVKNSGFSFPYKRVTVNLAPADLRKAGPAYDLPIAIAVIMASGQLAADAQQALFLGELSLDGTLRHTHGILPMVGLAREKNIPVVFVPEVDAREAALVKGAQVIPVSNLARLVAHLSGDEIIPPYVSSDLPEQDEDGPAPGTDFSNIKGQEHVKRALEVAAAGGHNVIMTGPPGSGKTLLARSLPSILPRMDVQEALEVSRIYSVSGLLPADTPLIRRRPFRAPHYTISHAGLVGGGRMPRPGEITLSHRGVLFLDELPEFGQPGLETLRQPLEDRIVTITRVQGTITFPANFMLIAAMNPCPCGYHGDPVRSCSCSPSTVSRYQKRISGPLLDRIDIFVEVPRVDYEKLADDRLAESSEAVRQRVEAARSIQRERFKGTKLMCNSDMTPLEVRQFCQVEPQGQSLLKTAMTQFQLSARAFHRILKLSRTIADLSGSATIGTAHLAEALQYRPRGMG